MEQATRPQVSIMGPKKKMHGAALRSDGTIVYTLEGDVVSTNRPPIELDPGNPIWTRVQAALAECITRNAVTDA